MNNEGKISDFDKLKTLKNRKNIAIEFAKSLNHSEIEKIILYGSVARSEDNLDSDIDILIVSTDKEKIGEDIYHKAFKILLELKEHISVKLLSLEDYNRIKNTHFVSNVEKDGILIG
ncbi:MAG: nucleotidyltransferase domain-containing protein [Methanobacteriaceae archaeon]